LPAAPRIIRFADVFRMLRLCSFLSLRVCAGTGFASDDPEAADLRPRGAPLRLLLYGLEF